MGSSKRDLKRTLRTANDVVRAVEDEYGPPLGKLWKQDIRDRYAPEILQGLATIADAVADIRRFDRLSRENAIAARGDGTARATSLKGRERAYQWFVSVWSAIEADNDPDVQAFRAQVLTGQLMDTIQVSDWVQRTARKEGTPTRIVEVPLGDRKRLQRGKEVTGPHVGFKFRTLESPGRKATERVPVRVGGTLDRLRLLSETLADQFGWQRAQATAFVLTGSVPLVPILLGTLDYSARRVTITADPKVSPQSVEQAYRQLRRELLDGRRWRHAEPHTYELAAHAAERIDQPWRQTMELWNLQHPEHRIDDVRQFRLTARRVWKQIG